MDCKLNNESILIGNTVFEGSSEQSVDVDFSLPDYCADIVKVLKCRAAARVTTRTITSDTLAVEGITRINVIYIGGKNETVQCYEYELPFACSFKMRDVPVGARAEISTRTEYVNCRAVSQRKLDIHGAFTVSARVTAPHMCEITGSIEGEGVYTRKCSTDSAVLVGSTQSSFIISEALEVGSTNESIGTVLRSDAVISVTERKAIAGKLVIKGEALFTLVYLGEAGGDAQRLEYTIGFSQFFDMSAIDDTCDVRLVLDCTGVDVGLRTDSTGEYRRMNVDIKAFATLWAYRKANIEAVCDAYCVNYEMQLERKQITLEKLCAVNEHTHNHQSVLDTGEIVFASITDLWCELRESSAALRGDSINVSSVMTVCLLGIDSSGSCIFIEKPVNLDYSLEYKNSCCNPRCDIHSFIRSCSFVIGSSGKVEIRAEVYSETAVYERTTLSCVTSAAIDASRAKNRDEMPALVLYFAQAGEELWDIAGRYNSCVETIMRDNELDSETIGENCMLLIAI